MNEWLVSFINQLDVNDAINQLSMTVSDNMKLINWGNIFRVCSFFLVAFALLTLIFYINDVVFVKYREMRIRRHQLTITNEGNTPSIFLFRPVELPRNVSIYFMVYGSPMIYVTRNMGEIKNEDKAAEAEKAAEQETAQSGKSENGQGGGLIPDLNNPLDIRETVNKGANKVRKDTGLLASILSGISVLLPGKNKTLDAGASALKGVQQDITDTTASLNSKANSADLLKSQVGSLSDELGPKDAKGKSSNTGKKETPGVQPHEQIQPKVPEFIELKDMIYDEEFWKQAKNEKRTEELGENYAQSQILKPGESMKIDLELRHLSTGTDAITHMYKIEVLQLPQSKLILSAPRQYINGIVAFPKIPITKQILPGWMVVNAIFVAVWILAISSRIIF